MKDNQVEEEQTSCMFTHHYLHIYPICLTYVGIHDHVLTILALVSSSLQCYTWRHHMKELPALNSDHINTGIYFLTFYTTTPCFL